MNRQRRSLSVSNPAGAMALCGLVAAALLVSIVTCSARAQESIGDSDQRLIQSLRSFLPHAMRLTGVPGLNIALARHGKVIWEEGFGYADIDKNTPMTAQTVMHSGSMGKLYTAVAVMQLVESGVIGLYDPINKHLKEFKVINPLGEREITFYDLLTHRSGLGLNNAHSSLSAPPPLGAHLKAAYASKFNEEFQGAVVPLWTAKVGAKTQYSNLGLATLGYLVQVTNPEKLSFSDYIQKHIIEPLGMKSTQFPPVQDAAHVRPDLFSRMSTGYARFGPIHIPTETIYFADHPAGTVVTIPGDHIRLLLALNNGGTLDGTAILRPETVRMMLTPQVEMEGMDGYWVGLIVLMKDMGKLNHSFGHNGAHMWGWTNQSRVLPEQDFAVVIATNIWPMVSELPRYHAGDLTASYISNWLNREQAGLGGAKDRPQASWAWKTSYVIGLMTVVYSKGFLGIKEPIRPERIDAMAKGARENRALDHGLSVWDEAGFRAGVEDMNSVENTIAGIRSLLRSNRLRIAPEELEILYREIEGRTSSPFLGIDSGN
jgi:CubicO group peptidase (beta-lactamase class C family)